MKEAGGRGCKQLNICQRNAFQTISKHSWVKNAKHLTQIFVNN